MGPDFRRGSDYGKEISIRLFRTIPWCQSSRRQRLPEPATLRCPPAAFRFRRMAAREEAKSFIQGPSRRTGRVERVGPQAEGDRRAASPAGPSRMTGTPAKRAATIGAEDAAIRAADRGQQFSGSATRRAGQGQPRLRLGRVQADLQLREQPGGEGHRRDIAACPRDATTRTSTPSSTEVMP